MCQAILGTVSALLVIVFFKDRPKTPPSASAEVKKDAFKPSVKALLSNKNVLMMMVIFGLIQGVFNTYGTVIGEMVNAYHYTDSWAAVFGAVFIFGGLVGSAVFGIYVEIKRKYKRAVIMICFFSIFASIGVLFSFINKIDWLTAIFCFLVGFFMIPIMAVGFEFGVEVTFPIGESMSTGLLMSAG